jgi:hypothetical protein
VVVAGGDGGVVLAVGDSVGRGELPVALLLGVEDLQHFLSFGGVDGGFVVLLDLQTVGLLLDEDGLAFGLFFSLLCLYVYHFLQDEVSELALVYLFIELLLEQLFLLPCQLHLRLLPLSVLPAQLLITFLMHFQHFHIEGFVLCLFVPEDVVSFAFLLLDAGLVLLLAFLIEGLELLVVLQELLVVEFLRPRLLRLLLLRLLLLREFADEALVLGQPQLLLPFLLLLTHLRLQRLPLLTELFQALIFLLTLTVLLADEILRHLGLDAVGVELILTHHLQGTLFGLLVQLELH